MMRLLLLFSVTAPFAEAIECSPQPLGLNDGRIPSSNIRVSSQDPNHPKDQLGTDGWCPAANDNSPWVEITLDKPTAVSVFAFYHPIRLETDPGRMFMLEFNLQYIAPVDSTRSLRTFADNMPALNRTHYFTVSTDPSIVTDTIRIVPVSQEVRACFRLELRGCDPTAMCTANWCKNNGTCIGQNVCKCPTGYFGIQCDQTRTQIVATQLTFVNITNNVLITAVPSISFAVQGNVNISTVPSKPGPVLTIKDTNSCIQMNVTATSASCITNIDLCTSGFTFAVDISFALLLDNTYIVSSGGNLPGDVGVALYYSQNNLYYIVSSSTFTWTLVVTYTPALNVWQHFEITWNPHLGVEILVNGRSLGTHGRPNPSGGSITLPLSIACSQTQVTVNVNMMVTGMTWWNFDRTMLVNAGIIPASLTSTTTSTTTATTTTQPSVTPRMHSTTTPIASKITQQLTAATTTQTPPPTTTTTPTSTAQIPSYGWSLWNINNTVVVGVHYNLTVHGTRPIDNVGVHLNTSGSYIIINALSDSCLPNPAACTTIGLTLQITMQFHKIEEHTYILTSGGQTPDGVGIAILYRYGKFQFVLTTFNMSWYASVGRDAFPADWLHDVVVSWSDDTGIEIFVNNVLFDYNRTPLPHRPTSPAYANAIFIGKQPSTSAGVNVDFTLREFKFWNARIEVLVDKGIFRPPVRPMLVGCRV